MFWKNLFLVSFLDFAAEAATIINCILIGTIVGFFQNDEAAGFDEWKIVIAYAFLCFFNSFTRISHDIANAYLMNSLKKVLMIYLFDSMAALKMTDIVENNAAKIVGLISSELYMSESGLKQIGKTLNYPVMFIAFFSIILGYLGFMYCVGLLMFIVLLLPLVLVLV